MDTVSELARAVLYEGYLLWPYRRSALKNQQRFAMNSVFPAAAGGTGAGTQCVLEVGSAAATVTVTVRFLHIIEREVLREGSVVDEARVDGKLYQSWEEACEREVELGGLSVADLANGRSVPLRVAAGSEEETIDANTTIRRRWHRLDGVLHLHADTPTAGVRALTVRLENTTACDSLEDRYVRHRGMASAHLALRIDGGEFVSAQDPPQWLRQEVDSCVSDGLWPVLVGETGDRHTMLAAPMVLYDWPRIAPESPGDLFDATEIDQLLVLNVLSMSDAEKEEMAAADPKAAAILERCTGMSNEQLMGLHGTQREVGEETW